MSHAVNTPAAPAETLTLKDCLAAARVAGLANEHDLREAMARAATGIPVDAFARAGAEWTNAFAAILDIPVGEMFKAACVKFSISAPESEIGLNGEVFVPLAPFVVESSHHPSVTASYGGIPFTFKFDVEISLEVQGAKLRIMDRQLVGARTGSAKGVAHISFLNLKPPVELASSAFELPGELRFGSSVPTLRDS
jgi:hypothetical protein